MGVGALHHVRAASPPAFPCQLPAPFADFARPHSHRYVGHATLASRLATLGVLGSSSRAVAVASDALRFGGFHDSILQGPDGIGDLSGARHASPPNDGRAVPIALPVSCRRAHTWLRHPGPSPCVARMHTVNRRRPAAGCLFADCAARPQLWLVPACQTRYATPYEGASATTPCGLRLCSDAWGAPPPACTQLET